MSEPFPEHECFRSGVALHDGVDRSALGPLGLQSGQPCNGCHPHRHSLTTDQSSGTSARKLYRWVQLMSRASTSHGAVG
jgi:hypothetical protein